MHLVHLKEETKALEEKVEDLLNKQLHIQDFKKSLNSLVERLVKILKLPKGFSKILLKSFKFIIKI